MPRRMATPIAVAGLLLVVTGCAYQQQATSWESRYWEPEYREIVTVRTEPSGAKIYVGDDYVGVSPLEVPTSAGKARVTQNGTYTQAWTHDDFSGQNYGHRRATGTSWGDSTYSMGTAEWTFKAFLDGHDQGIRTLRIDGNDPVVKAAFAPLEVSADGKFPTVITGRRTILIPLSAQGWYRMLEQQQQQQQQQSTVVVPGQQQPEKESTGTVIVSANVDGAEVNVDGVFVGNAPANLKLKEGIHIIEVKKDGYQTFKRELRVLANSEVALRATLEK